MSEMPTWDGFAMPVLRVLSDGEEWPLRGVIAETMDTVGLDEAARTETLGSGQPKAHNRIGWAVSYLQRVGAIERPRRGHYVISALGRSLIDSYPQGLTEADFRTLAKPGDEWWVTKRTAQDAQGVRPTDADVDRQAFDLTSIDPVEQIETGLARIHDEVRADLSRRLQGSDPAFFEQAVVKLLVAMGYGGSDGRATVTKQSGDEGIDGIIDQDALGLNRVYVQAKRYAEHRTVGRPDLQAFVGALSGKADGGVFITTARFSQEARVYADAVPSRLILIDGQRLTALMIRYGVGVQTKQTYQLVEIDEDFFE